MRSSEGKSARGPKRIRALVWLGLALFAATVAPAAPADIEYVYDELGRLIASIDPAGQTNEYVYDEVGNLLSVSRRPSSVVAILTFTPGQGAVGTAVTIQGTGFGPDAGSNSVTFGGTPAVVTSATVTTIVTSVPPGAVSGPLAVTAPGGTAASASAFTVLVPQPPQIASFSPTVATPGQAVTLSGSGFAPIPSDNLVIVNTTRAAVTTAAEAALVARVPAASGGKIKVSTELGAATSLDDLFVVPPPRAVGDVGDTGRIEIGGPSRPVSLAAGKIALLLFDGEAGAPGVRVTAFETFAATGGSFTVHGPNGAILAGPAILGTGTGTNSALSLPPLPTTGTYSVLLSLPAGGTSNVSAWRDLSGTLTEDGPAVDLTFTIPGQVARLTFEGQSGQRLGLDLSNVALSLGDGLATVTNPSGGTTLSQFFSSPAGAGLRMSPLVVSGIYTVTITPLGSGTGTVRVALWSDVGGTLAVNELNAVSLPYRNQYLRKTFVGTVGQRLGVDVADIVGFSDGTVSVARPDGVVINGQNFGTAAGAGVRTGPLTHNGLYTVVVQPSASATGAFKLTLYADVGDELTVDTPYALKIAHRTQQARLPFAGVSGQYLGVDVSGVTWAGGGTVSVLRPDGVTINALNFSSPSGGGMRSGLLTADGLYTVIVAPTSSTVVGEAAVTLWSDVGGNLAVNVVNEVGVPYRNQYVRKTFAGAVGQRLGVDVAEIVGFGSGTVSVTRPDGVVMNAQNFSTAAGAGVRTGALTQNGLYSVIVQPAADSTGALKLTLYSDVGDELTVGTPYALKIVSRTQQARLPFTFASGQSLGVDVSGVTWPGGGTVTVLRPDGVAIAAQNFDSPAGTSVRLGVQGAGDYTVVIAPHSASAVGDATVTVWSDVSGNLVLGEVNDIDLSYRNQYVRKTFVGTEGQRLGVDVAALEGFSSGTVTVFRPDGVAIAADNLSTAAGLGLRLGTVTSGTYTVVVAPASSSTGSLEVTLWSDVSGNLVLHEVNDIDLPYRNQYVRKTFVGTEGQRLGVDVAALEGFSSGTVTVFRPDGVAIAADNLSTAAGLGLRVGTVTSGTYTVVVAPASNSTGSLRLTLWSDLSDALTLGAPRSLTIAYRNQQGRPTFDASLGQVLGLELSAVTLPAGGAVNWLRPDGVPLVSQAFGAAGITLDLPTVAPAGSFTVQIVPNASGTGGVVVRVFNR